MREINIIHLRPTTFQFSVTLDDHDPVTHEVDDPIVVLGLVTAAWIAHKDDPVHLVVLGEEVPWLGLEDVVVSVKELVAEVLPHPDDDKSPAMEFLPGVLVPPPGSADVLFV